MVDVLISFKKKIVSIGILHIEDNESISESMGVFLKHHGFSMNPQLMDEKDLN